MRESTRAHDERRAAVARMALADERDYKLVLLHLTDIDSQGFSHGKSDEYNRANSNSSAHSSEAEWSEFIPDDPIGIAWRTNSYKRAIARSGDLVDQLLEQFGDERTTFLIAGDHGHVAPGGSGGATDEVRHVPFFAYRKGSNMGVAISQARRAAGSDVDAARWPRAPPRGVRVCGRGGQRPRHHGRAAQLVRRLRRAARTVENVDLAPTVMALLYCRCAHGGVFIDDVVG